MLRSRRKVVILVNLAFLVLALPGSAAAPPPTPAHDGMWDEKVVSISGESLPVGIRLATFVKHTIYFIREHLAPGGKGIEYVRIFLEGTGLEKVDAATLAALQQLFGDFNERQQERWREAFGGKDHLPEAVGEAFAAERTEFVGVVFGRWLRQIEQEGHDTGAIVRAIDRGRARGSSRVMGGENVPSYEALEEEGRLFEAAFEREFGRPLRTMLQARGEVEQ